ncbi:hypothetical protein J1614_006120 [Plenodomus biglobosus]|nr:hypothetical protein J1614_006120 [Plenodomus biglobosus]
MLPQVEKRTACLPQFPRSYQCLRAGPHRCNEVLTRLSLASHVPVSLTARPSSIDQQGYSFNDYMSFCSYCKEKTGAV